MAALTYAEKARLAHSVLRLRENGVTDESQLNDLALSVPSAPIEEDQTVAAVAGGNPLARIAVSASNALDSERPGPTDRPYVEGLFNASLTEIWEAWDANVRNNLQEAMDPAEYAALEESWARDAEEAAGRAGRVFETGSFPVHPAFGHNRSTEGAANALYDEGRAGFLAGEIDWDTAAIKVVLVDSADYAVNLATHKFLSSVAAAGRVATSGAFANKTTAAGVADADDVTLTAVTGDPSEALVIYQSSAVGGGGDVADTAQRLIAYIDTATGLPVTPNGGNINIVWDSGANRIFKL